MRCWKCLSVLWQGPCPHRVSFWTGDTDSFQVNEETKEMEIVVRVTENWSVWRPAMCWRRGVGQSSWGDLGARGRWLPGTGTWTQIGKMRKSRETGGVVPCGAEGPGCLLGISKGPSIPAYCRFWQCALGGVQRCPGYVRFFSPKNTHAVGISKIQTLIKCNCIRTLCHFAFFSVQIREAVFILEMVRIIPVGTFLLREDGLPPLLAEQEGMKITCSLMTKRQEIHLSDN